MTDVPFDISSLLRQASFIDPANVDYLDDLMLDKDGSVKPIESAKLDAIPLDHIRIWCGKNAIYQICTVELVEWLKNEIAGRNAIEIGAGVGGIGKALGIHSTDSYMQTNEAVAQYYKALGQKPTQPPSYVEKIDANDAVDKYKPEVVVGAFITHRHTGGDVGNAFGPLEEQIINKATYIHVGNINVHKSKPILALPHKEYTFPWLRTRCANQSLNRIWIWNGN
jgi:hypothetical protein